MLNKLFALFEVLDTAGADCLHAIPSQAPDYEDAVMIETAIRTEVDGIVTRNIHDYTNAPVPIYTPDAFIKKLEMLSEEL